jgi:hypothetical protein
MISRVYYSHYRAVHQTIGAGVTVGAAVLFGYFILMARL